MTVAVTLDDTVVSSTGLVAAGVGGELVILSLAEGQYFGLNAVAVRIWEMIAQPRSVAAVRDQLLLEYPDVDPARCTQDLLNVLTDLHDAALIELNPARD